MNITLIEQKWNLIWLESLFDSVYTSHEPEAELQKDN